MSWLPGVFGKSNPQGGNNPQSPQGGQGGMPAPNPGVPQSMVNNPNAAGNIQQNQNAGVGTPGAGNGNPTEPQNPMDQFSALFKPAAAQPNAAGQPGVGNGNQNPQNTPPSYDGYTIAMDPQTLRQQAGQFDFTRNVNPELMQKALGGDMQALIQMMNNVVQEAWQSSALLAHGLAEKAGGSAFERTNKGLDSRFRDFTVKSQNPTQQWMQHEAVQPMVNAIKAQIARSDPSLNAEQVMKRTEEYFSTMMQIASPPQQSNGNPNDTNGGQKGTSNWLDSLGIPGPTQ